MLDNRKELPKTVVNKATGETVTFLETAAQSNGKLLWMEVKLPPKGVGPPLHSHDQFVEAFECMQGELTLLYKDSKNKMVLKAGETFEVQPNEAHTFTNKDGIEEVVFRVKLTPPSYFEESMRIHYALMDAGLTDKKGNPRSIYYTALILSLQNTRIIGVSIKLQRRLFGFLVKRGMQKGKFTLAEEVIGKPLSELQLF